MPAHDPLAALAEQVADEHGVPVTSLRGARALPGVAKIRAKIIHAARRLTKPNGEPRYSYTQIGNFFCINAAMARSEEREHGRLTSTIEVQ
jgi:hypothetical protein